MRSPTALIDLIFDLRRDLRQRFGTFEGPQQPAVLEWLVAHGVKEFPALKEDPGFLALMSGREAGDKLTRLQRLVWSARPDLRKAFPLPQRLAGYLNWYYSHGLQELGLWPLLSEGERAQLGVREPWKSRYVKAPAPERGFAERPFGMNVIGYAFGQLGIGEDARMATQALAAAGVPVTLHNFPPGRDIPQNDRSMEAFVADDTPYAFNLFCMTAQETGRFYAQRGSAMLKGRYNIGYWPWELSRWPEAWTPVVDLMDEIWVSSRHIYDALSPVSPVPVLVMPMAVSLGKVPRRRRADFGLPAKAKLFVFAFDLSSYVHRKNPQACLEAFARAFPNKGKGRLGREEVGLVIKTHKPPRANAEWEALKRLAKKDDRIHIVEKTLDRPELLALYAACDCFLSLHRAEGFGRGLAEALQLGLHVIATGYSGNVDFCRAPEADLVKYKLVPVGKDEYTHAEGQVWAEPDVDHAAELMRQFVEKRGKRPASKDWPAFSPQVVGKRYRDRLLLLRSRSGKG